MMPQGLVGFGLMLMLASDLIGFLHTFFCIGFYLGVAVAATGVIWLGARERSWDR